MAITLVGNITDTTPHPALITAPTQLVSWVDGGTFTSGQADVYAIIATPAA
jgi:hypothetical protein